MDIIRRKVQHRLQKSAENQAKHKKIIIVPDESVRRREGSDQKGQAARATISPTSSPSNIPPGRHSSKPEAVKMKDVPVAQLVDLSLSDLESDNSIRILPKEAYLGLPSSGNASIGQLKDDPTWAWILNDSPTAASKLLLYLPLCTQFKVLGYLPMRDLFSLARVNRSLNEVVGEEVQRRRKTMAMQLLWRKDFIRHVNQSFSAASKTVLMRHHVFRSIWDGLFFRPAFVIVCYSPDVFEYEIRVQVTDGNRNGADLSHNVFHPDLSVNDSVSIKEKAGSLLDHMMEQGTKSQNKECATAIWHMRLFTVLKPCLSEPGETYLWSSEDLTLLFLPNDCKITFSKGSVEYSDLMEYPMLDRYYANGNMLRPIIEMISHRRQPKFLLLSLKDFPQNFQPISYSFPIVVCDISPFKNYPEEYLCLTGNEVKVHQIVLEAGHSRSQRDEKIRSLHNLCALGIQTTMPGNLVQQPQYNLNRTYQSTNQWMLFYLTEMWPGGTSKECPSADTRLLRTLFGNAPLLGGRAKHLMANQSVVFPNTATATQTDACALRRLQIPTVITAISVN